MSNGLFRAPIGVGMVWRDATDKPAAGGTMEWFAAGTVTDQPTYTDGVSIPPVANANPITLDATGKVPGNVDIWLSSGVIYKLQIKDSLGNNIATIDNLVGVDDPLSAGGLAEWRGGPTPLFASTTSFTAAGDQVSGGPLYLNQRVKIVQGGGTVYGTVSTSVYNIGTNRTTVTVVVDGGTALTNPLTSLATGLFNPNSPSIPQAQELRPGAAYYAALGGTIVAYGPLGSNMLAFAAPPALVASANISSGVVNGVAGSLLFFLGAHGRLDGEAVQVSTSNTLPGNIVAVTTYIVSRVDANNFGLYVVPAGWVQESPLLNATSNLGGLTWGSPIAYASAGSGNETVTPGFVPPPNITRVRVRVVGGGGGGAGGTINTNSGGGGGGGGYTEGLLAVTPGTWIAATVGAGGIAGNAATNGNSGNTSSVLTMNATGGAGGQSTATSSTGGIGAGGLINLSGGRGRPGTVLGGNNVWGGQGGDTPLGSGSTGDTAIAATGGGAGGGGGYSNAASSLYGSIGSPGLIIVQW
jgi:hypothetical protein